ncbi:hypothetical protein [Pseudokineococcus sp. 1T1Z-3]|uniref:hypothetical protein n=1 Tax=Pseudokineococcus sp. 1T1Z-3 TaxID=3132745 RepID=UPI0030A72B26
MRQGPPRVTTLGKLTREQMLESLTTRPYEPSRGVQAGEWDPAPASEPAGSFEATVGRALDDGLLTGENYDAVLDALAD